MADFEFEPPSFSLGLDLDVESEPPSNSPIQPVELPSTSTSAAFQAIEAGEDDDFEYPVRVSLQRVSEPPLALKRLRKGPTPLPKSEGQDGEANPSSGKYNVDDEIEVFSSEEDWPRAGNPPSHSVCSISKPSLHGRKVLTTQSGCLWKSTKRKEVLGATTSGSPLRRFQLIGSSSDSDGPSDGEGVGKELGCSLSLEVMQSNSSQHAASSFLGTAKGSAGNHKIDLWKDFPKENNFCIPTPAFDEVCDEFFRSRKCENEVEIKCEASANGEKLDLGSFPPAHRYFFHDDSRIQKLVRDRLPNFFPLRAAKNEEHQQQKASVIDYLHQFGHENSKKTYRGHNVETSSKKARKNVAKSSVILPEDSDNWVNPKSSGIPKDAGKRRVIAAGKSGGHWYTSSNGKRVYVSRNGQELTGQSAYRGYKKESGGFKNSKKKAATKKKPAAKKQSASKKK